MRQSVKYMFAIKSNWISFDTMSSFKPFVTSLLLKENLERGFDQEISNLFEKEYGFKLPYFILTNIISSYISTGYAENRNSFLYFDLKKMVELPKISFDESKQFNIEYDSLIKDFALYCKSSDISYKVSEKTIMAFVRKYDAQLMGTNFDISDYDDMEVEMYFFYMYLKEQAENKTSKFDFILRLCQGNLIKSFLFNEGIEQVDIKESHIYLDSPILYRILGYYGDYYESEYKYLMELWKQQGVSMFIFKHNFEEIINLLERCKSALEDIHFNYAKVPRIALFFREIGLSPIDIDEKIVTLKDDLSDLGIEIKDCSITEFEEKYIESEEEIRELIKNTYFSSNKYSTEDMNSYSLNKMIDMDVKSVMFSYGLRKGNSNRSFDENSLFFVTRNSGLISAILDYNKNKYQGTISPIIRDSLIGMISCSKDMAKIHELVEKSIVSFCYTAFKPSRKVLEIFTNQVENMKNENQITDQQYLLLKHNKAVLPNLVMLTNDSYTNITYKTIHELLVKVESDIIDPISQEYDKKISDIEVENEGLKQSSKELEERLSQEKKEKNDNYNEYEKEKSEKERMKKNILEAREKEYKTVERSIYIYAGILIFLITGILVTANIIVFAVNPNITFWSFILVLATVVQPIWGSVKLFSQKRESILFVKYFINKAKNKIDVKYSTLL